MGRLGRGEAGEKHRIQFDDGQWEQLEGVMVQLDVKLDITEGDGDDTAEGDEEESEEQATALDEAVFRFCGAILKQKVAFNVYINPLLHFAAVLGISDHTGG